MPDRPASPDNTIAYELNLTECFESNLESTGVSFDPGEEGRLNFGAALPGNDNDAGRVELDFVRELPPRKAPSRCPC